MISTNLKQYAYGSIALGVIGNIVGILIYEASRFPVGPSIILVNSLLFAAILLFKKFPPAGSLKSSLRIGRP